LFLYFVSRETHCFRFFSAPKRFFCLSANAFDFSFSLIRRQTERGSLFSFLFSLFSFLFSLFSFLFSAVSGYGVGATTNGQTFWSARLSDVGCERERYGWV
jgi:hypothetical protein